MFWDAEIDDERVRFIALREYARLDEDDEDEEDVAPEKEVGDASGGALLVEDPAGEEESVAPGAEGDLSGSTDHEFLFIVGLDKEYIYERLVGTAEATVPALLIGLALMMFFVWLAVNRNLKPLKTLEHEVKSISVSNMAPCRSRM